VSTRQPSCSSLPPSSRRSTVSWAESCSQADGFSAVSEPARMLRDKRSWHIVLACFPWAPVDDFSGLTQTLAEPVHLSQRSHHVIERLVGRVNMQQAGSVLNEDVPSWEGVSVHPQQFAAQGYPYGRADVGHIHFWGDVDIPFSSDSGFPPLRETSPNDIGRARSN